MRKVCIFLRMGRFILASLRRVDLKAKGFLSLKIKKWRWMEFSRKAYHMVKSLKPSSWILIKVATQYIHLLAFSAKVRNQVKESITSIIIWFMKDSFQMVICMAKADWYITRTEPSLWESLLMAKKCKERYTQRMEGLLLWITTLQMRRVKCIMNGRMGSSTSEGSKGRKCTGRVRFTTWTDGWLKGCGIRGIMKG